MTAAEKYADWVLNPSNELETGRYIKLAAKRFKEWLKRDDLYFDEVEAVKMVDFCENYLCQWEGDWEGVPLKFEPWQRFIFEQVYGWIKKSDGTRVIEEVFVQVSKKNGKSTMSAGLMNYHLFADERIKTPKVFTAANDREQAMICVNMAGKMVEASPALAEMVDDGLVGLMNYKENITEVINYENNGFIKAFSKEAGDKTLKTSGGKQGRNPSLGVVDEFGMASDHGASGSIKTGMMSRLLRLMFYITTSGFNLDGPCFKELRKVGIDILEGREQNDSYLIMIFEIDPPKNDKGEDMPITIEWLIENEQVWRQSNPNLDVSVHRSALRSMLKDAKQYRGTREVEVKTLNFNIWVNSPSVFISSEIWGNNHHGINEDELLGERCFGGIEIASGRMLNSFVLLFPDINGKAVVKSFFWMPEEYKKDNVQLSEWSDEGHIWVDSGNVVDNEWVCSKLFEHISKYDMHSFAFKTNLENHDIVQNLIKESIKGDPISHGRQGISTPTLIWEEMLSKGEIEHFNNPVLTWMNSNCSVVRKDNDIRLEKSGSKVVGIYAAINAIAQWKTIDSTEGSGEIGILYL